MNSLGIKYLLLVPTLYLHDYTPISVRGAREYVMLQVSLNFLNVIFAQ